MKQMIAALFLMLALATQYVQAGTTPQTITYPVLANHAPGDADFSIGATTTSGLALTYASSNPLVATVNATTGVVHIVGSGKTSISVSQAGNSTYASAFAVRVLRVMESGVVTYWGANRYNAPVAMPMGVQGVVDISGGKNPDSGDPLSFLLLNNGNVLLSTNNGGNLPTPIPELSNIIAISSDGTLNLALAQDGRVYWWGLMAGSDFNNRGWTRAPRLLPELSDIVEISGSFGGPMALKRDGCVYVDGQNGFVPAVEKVGVSSTQPLCGVVSIASGSGHFLALKSDGSVSSWGKNNSGQLGYKTYMDHSTTEAETIPGLSGVVSITAGGEQSLALKSDGHVIKFNAEWDGGRNIDLDVYGVTDGVAVDAGEAHFFVLKSDGTVIAWGSNSEGQLGIGSTATEDRSFKVIPDLGGVTAIDATKNQSLAIVSIPVLSSISTKAGPVTGGTVVTITGRNFRSATKVKFGSYDAQSMTIVSDTEIRATTYAHSAGIVDITVSTRYATSQVVAEGKFTFVSVPAISSLSPDAGSVGTLVTITGTNFTDATVVKFGSVPGTDMTVVSPTKITVKSPALDAGGYGVTVTTKDGGTSEAKYFSNSPVIQTLNFPALPSKNVTSADFNAGVTLSTGLPLTYSSSNPNVATINATTGLIHIVGNGETTIAASNSSTGYTPAFAVRVLRVRDVGAVAGWGANYNGQLGIRTIENYVGISGIPELTDVVDMSLGLNHTIALKADGTVVSFGSNSSGELGIGVTGGNRTSPVLVNGLSNVVAISTKSDFNLALKGDGTVVSWGSNLSGELGNGTTIKANTPTLIPGLTNIVAISAGANHSLALRSDGRVLAWGGNASGQVGNNSTANQTTPVVLSGLSQVVAIASGSLTSFALKRDGTMMAWGDNDNYEIGNSSVNLVSLTPVNVTGLSGIVAIAPSMALKENGQVYRWGQNNVGQVGNGTNFNQRLPIAISELADVREIAWSFEHAFAIKKDGTLLAWGYNGNLALGFGEVQDTIFYPTPVARLADVKRIFTGAYWHSLAFIAPPQISLVNPSKGTELGGTKVVIQGKNFFQNSKVYFAGVSATQLQIDSVGVLSAVSPTGVAGNVALTVTNHAGSSIAVPAAKFFYLKEQVFSFSKIDDRKLGDPDFTVTPSTDSKLGLIFTSSNPNVATVNRNTGKVSIVGPGETWIIASQSGNDIYAPGKTMQHFRVYGKGRIARWGAGFRKTPESDQTQLEYLALADRASAHNIALKTDGTVVAWGYNNYGQLGDGSNMNSNDPVVVSGLSDIVAVASGSYSSYALKRDGTVYAWGNNNRGQLGNGTTTASNVPVMVSGLSDVVSLSASEDHVLAIKNDGTVYGWGDNLSGQLGGSSNYKEPTPIQIGGLEDVVSVSAGGNNATALLWDGSVLSFGCFDFCRDGITREDKLSDVVAISSGRGFFLALKKDGTVWGKGINQAGQLGDGTIITRENPVQTIGVNNAVALTAGYSYSMALLTDGSIQAWGENYSGELGDGTDVNREVPVYVQNIEHVLSIYGGTGRTSYAIVALPQILALSTQTGPATGCTEVTLTGAYFTADSKVFFGQTEATQVNVVGANMIKVMSPVGVGGMVHIQVKTPFGGMSEESTADEFTYTKLPQTIAFDKPEDMLYGSTKTVTAISDVGLTVEFRSTTQDVCMISLKGDITTESVGECEIEANQSGNGTYLNAILAHSFEVLPESLVVSAGDQKKTYGASDAKFRVTMEGFVNGDDESVVSGLQVKRTPGDTVGTYVITPSAAKATNYMIRYKTGLMTIDPAPLSVVARDTSITLGAKIPVFTYKVTGLIGSDKLSGALACDAPNKVGTYQITKGTLSAGPNYKMSFTGAELEILKPTSIQWRKNPKWNLGNIREWDLLGRQSK